MIPIIARDAKPRRWPQVQNWNPFSRLDFQEFSGIPDRWISPTATCFVVQPNKHRVPHMPSLDLEICAEHHFAICFGSLIVVLLAAQPPNNQDSWIA
jgi:hypothetical protein